MNRNDLLDLIEEIQTRNYNTYTGLNEADLATREEIADLVMSNFIAVTELNNSLSSEQGLCKICGGTDCDSDSHK